MFSLASGSLRRRPASALSDQDSIACSYRIDSADDFRFGELAYLQREMLRRVRARGTD